MAWGTDSPSRVAQPEVLKVQLKELSEVLVARCAKNAAKNAAPSGLARAKKAYETTAAVRQHERALAGTLPAGLNRKRIARLAAEVPMPSLPHQ